MLLQSVNAYHNTTHGVAVGYGINILEELTKRYVEYYATSFSFKCGLKIFLSFGILKKREVKMTYFEKQNLWLEKANELLPVLQHKVFKPLQVVDTVSDEKSFQGWRVDTVGTVEEIYQKTYGENDSFILDFGEHITGYLKFKINKFGQHDAPLRLKIIFGEVPAEVSEPFDPKTAGLSRSWLQDEIINIDETPVEINMPRRYAFRYLKIELIDTSSNYRIGFENIVCDAVTSGSFDLPVDADVPADLLSIDMVSLRTLRDCMQTVYEDGPKRDRRLWLGDLRLMMMSNAVSFRNFDLVRRCLYLFAGLAQEDGLIAGCVYERPVPSLGNNLLTYSCLLAPVLYDYATECGDWQTAEELLPVAARQLDIVWDSVNEDGLFCNQPGNWLFFDWCPELDNTAAMQATVIYCLRALLKLALQADDNMIVSTTTERLAMMIPAAERMYDDNSGLFVSGEKNQISWGTQAWMVLAEVVTDEKAAGVLRRMIDYKAAIRPNGPYLYHHVIHAMLISGLKSEATEILKWYWGGMIDRGATTFWEVFSPGTDRFSAYGNFLIDSYCHAWSATPAYLIRRYLKD
jgi:hypothetical protein